MRFVVDEDLPRSTDELLRRYGHEAVDLESFLQREYLVARMSGKLAIVEPGRVRIRTA